MTTGGAAISWSMLRDVSGIRSLEEMRDLFHSDLSRSDSFGSQSMKAGQLFDFLHNVNEQDFVLTPIKETKTVRIGKIDGPYRYDETMFGFVDMNDFAAIQMKGVRLEGSSIIDFD